MRKSRDKGFDLRSMGQAPLQAEAIVQGAFLNSTAIVEAIREAVAQGKIRGKDVAASVSGHSVIVKRVHLPQMSREELEGQIPVGGRAVHPVRRQRGQPRLPDPHGQSRRGTDGRAARRRQEGSDRRLRAGDHGGRSQSGRDRRGGLRCPERLRDELRPGCHEGDGARQHRGAGRQHQRHPQRHPGLHARHHDRRRALHRGDPEGALDLLRGSRAHQARQLAGRERRAGT